uniref:Small ribosomal subunit protein uS5 n=1 Tax=Euplotes harpa TaxID=151035 RepID=A0A7S3NCZ0_9SPIT|mmetsp:Transcript_32745/g.37410  ORF Transcript_32745/g.37410 Transcript_32745/m.37410 type:complete len:346 (+) Transcript_32745:35-1072(+)
MSTTQDAPAANQEAKEETKQDPAAAPSAAPARDGFRGGFGGKRRGGRKKFEEEWVPVTKLGRLVKSGQIRSLEEIYNHALPIKEYQIIDYFVKDLHDEVMKIASVQKQTRAGQRTRFKAVIAIGDKNGHVGIGVKVAKEVQIAIQDGLKNAKVNLIPVRRGYWGNKIGDVHTVPCKITGKCGSVKIRLIPASKGIGVVGAPVSKKILHFAGIQDCYTSSTGQTATTENFLKATYIALKRLYGIITPDLWNVANSDRSPMDVHSEFLKNYKDEFEKKRRGRGGRGRGGRGRGGPSRGGSRGRGGPRGFGRGRGGNYGDNQEGGQEGTQTPAAEAPQTEGAHEPSAE